MARYEIRPLGNLFAVWDNELRVWQTTKPTHEEAKTWITAKETHDKQPHRPTLDIRMPLRD
jgi:hypothetical protein